MDEIGLVELILFLIVAYLAGTAAANIMEGRSQRGVRRLRNTFLGGLGAFVGQVLLNVLDINLGGIFTESISLGEVAVAFIGAVIVLFVVRRLK